MASIDWDRYRVIDLSLPMTPGEEDRRLEIVDISRFDFDNSYQYAIEMTTHLGTHIEAPAHYDEEGPFTDDIPIERCFGEMLLFRFDFVSPRAPIDLEAYRQALKGRDVSGRIVIFRSPYFYRPSEDEEDRRPYVEPEVVEELTQRGIKMFGFDNSISIDETAEAAQAIHHLLFAEGVPILEYMGNLHLLQRDEAILFALPLPIGGLDASPVRVLALEEK